MRLNEQEPINRTRTEEQSHVDYLYANSSISREEWIEKTNELSDITLWGPEGKRKHQNLQTE